MRPADASPIPQPHKLRARRALNNLIGVVPSLDYQRVEDIFAGGLACRRAQRDPKTGGRVLGRREAPCSACLPRRVLERADSLDGPRRAGPAAFVGRSAGLGCWPGRTGASATSTAWAAGPPLVYARLVWCLINSHRQNWNKNAGGSSAYLHMYKRGERTLYMAHGCHTCRRNITYGQGASKGQEGFRNGQLAPLYRRMSYV